MIMAGQKKFLPIIFANKFDSWIYKRRTARFEDEFDNKTKSDHMMFCVKKIRNKPSQNVDTWTGTHIICSKTRILKGSKFFAGIFSSTPKFEKFLDTSITTISVPSNVIIPGIFFFSCGLIHKGKFITYLYNKVFYN